MQTYKYEELDERGQIAAVKRYEKNKEVQDKILDIALNWEYQENQDIEVVALKHMGWRFNEHGERIA